MNLGKLGWIVLVVVVLLRSGSAPKRDKIKPQPSPVAPSDPDIIRPEGEPDRIIDDLPSPLPLPTSPGACQPSRGDRLHSPSTSQRQGFFRRVISRWR